MTERLQKCIDAGGVVELFPLLKDWSEDELKALVEDCNKLHEENVDGIERAYKEQVFKPEMFLNRANSKALDEAKKKAYCDSLGICSEISSVAQFYLEKK